MVLVARDHERRAPRAYVVVDAKLMTSLAEVVEPVVMLTAENMGQTPVYDLFFATWADIAERGSEEFPFRTYMDLDCHTADEWRRDRGQTFSKTRSHSTGVGTKGPTPNVLDLFEEGKILRSYGTICYRTSPVRYTQSACA